MTNSITTDNALDNLVYFDAKFADGALNFGQAGTEIQGTILARDSVSLKFVPFVLGGTTNENGIPKAILTYDVTATVAGDIGVRPLVSGKIRVDDLVISGGNQVTQQVKDTLSSLGMTTVSVQELTIIGPDIAEPPAFRSQWKTDNPGLSNNDQITIPTEASGTYNATVDWGDGTIETGLITFNDARWTHTYTASGTFNVKITGTIKGFRFNNTGDKDKLLDISEWGVLNLGNSGGYFFGCTNLIGTATDVLDLTGTTSLNNCFQSCTNFNGAIGNWNTEFVTRMAAMFRFATSFNKPIGNWVVSSVTDMSSIFNGATSFNQPIGNWNTASVTSMFLMFTSASAFNQFIGNWNTAVVGSMFRMFESATAFDQNLGNWVVSSVTDMTNMLLNSGLTRTNYDLILIGWESLASLQNNVNFSAGSTQFSAGAAATARADIISNFSWTITDGGQAP